MGLTKGHKVRKRRLRVRNRLRRAGSGRPRLSVHRSNRNISVQLIDDRQGRTLAAASTLEKDLGLWGRCDKEAAARIGATMAERATAAGVRDVAFDRGAYLYHGRIRALADAAREGGLNF